MGSIYLMLAFFTKHYLADFPLQTVYMLGKGRKGWAWVVPLATHAFVHTFFTALIIAFYDSKLLYLCLIDFSLHFVIDRIKATYRLKEGTWESHEKGKLLSQYYNALGLDQYAHALTYILIIYLLTQ